MRTFFPDVYFGWGYLAVLVVYLIILCRIDIRVAKIPNRYTVQLLICGLLVNAIRGGLLGSSNRDVWLLTGDSALIGAIDGLLFSLWGFVAAFAIYFTIWILGACGGGDVKLMAAIGAYVGGLNALLILILTIATVAIWFTLKVLFGGGFKKVVRDSASERQLKAEGKKLPKGRITFSLPALIAAIVLILWLYRFDLHLERMQAP